LIEADSCGMQQRFGTGFTNFSQKLDQISQKLVQNPSNQLEIRSNQPEQRKEIR
jgi:hypothetical protein